MLWRPNPVNAGIFAYYGVCVLSTLDAWRIDVEAWDPSVAFFEILKMLEFYMVFFMVGLAASNLKEIRRHLTVFFVVAFIVSTYAIFSIGRLSRVSAPFEAGGTEPNTLGGYLTIVICLAAALMLCAPSRKWKFVFAFVAMLSFVPFVMTLSRASYLALVVGFIALGMLSRRFSILALVAVVLFVSPWVMPEEVRKRVNYTFQESGGESVSIAGNETGLQIDTSTYERIYVWQKVKFNLTVWPWFGGGVSWETVLDSQYARVLIETGVVGFTAFLFLLYRVFKTARESFRWSRDWVARGIALGVAASTVGLIVHGMGTISFLIVRIMEPFWFLLALSVVAREVALREHTQRVLAWKESKAKIAEPIRAASPAADAVLT